MKINTILCPIDFSMHNHEVNDYASALASSTGAKIVYLHITTPEAPYGDYGNVDPSEMMAKDLKRLKNYQPTVAWVKHNWEVDFGPTAQRIVEFANDRSVSLIVIGTHGRTGLPRVLMGSVAESVIRQAKCPVLAIKLPMPEGKTACANSKFVDELRG